MKIFNKALLTMVILAIAAVSLSAQSRKLKQGQKEMDRLNYVGAIEIYNKLLEKGDNPDAIKKIAECYRKISDPENGEYWYGQVVNLPDVESIDKLYYGEMLQRNGKCDKAKQYFQEFSDEVPGDSRGKLLAQACDKKEELMTKSEDSYDITHLNINSNLDDFSPTVHDGELVFSSERDKGSAVKRRHCWTGNPFLELYKAKADGETVVDACNDPTFKKPQKFSKVVNSKYHDAAISYNNQTDEVFFTRNNYENGKLGKADDGTVNLEIFHTAANGSGKLKSLPFNSKEYSVAHPALSADGSILYFSSNMPGGIGGMDLYYSERDGETWGPAQNMGPSINTEGNEVFPYMDAKKKFFFSSDSREGLGGLDIYSTMQNDEGEWSTPDNLGYPMNTTSDDFGLVMNEKATCGYFSSDRPGGAGRDDIYSFKKTATPLEIYVFDENTKEPIEGAEVVDDCTGKTYTTGKDGKVHFDMKMNKCCTFNASKELYDDNGKEGCTNDIELGDLVLVEIPLAPQGNYRLEGIAYDKSTGLPLAGTTVMLTNDCGDQEQSVVTDADGAYGFDLIGVCCYLLKGSKTDYLNDTKEGLCTQDLTQDLLTGNLYLLPTKAPVDNYTPTTAYTPTSIYKDADTGLYIDPATGDPANGEYNGLTYKNGVMEGGYDTYVETTPDFEVSPTTYEEGDYLAYLLHIYYDFDQSYIRKESETDLNKLYNLMLENPDQIIELCAHTDARGSSRYNMRLSQRRAEAARDWLIKKGIDGRRLVARGYGETMPVNECKNHVRCSERKHQFNRRTEFKVLGCMSCVDQDNALLSQPKPKPKLDKCHNCPF